MSDDEFDAPTAKREIPAELREEAMPATPRPHTTIRLNQADIDALIKHDVTVTEPIGSEDRETLPAPSSRPKPKNGDKP